jgi:glycosyltransferase involved in cell wall biosynthesis
MALTIANILPGAGGTFYCQNCLRDCALVKALRKQGHDAIAVPMYLPILVDAEGLSGDVPVFFGGINVYLQQKIPFFRKTPRWLDRVLDSGWMLKRAAKQEGSTEAAGLGPMTLSMLRGAQGNQKKELDRLIEWLTEHEQPDIIHLSNSLLLGLAKPLRDALNIPVVCSLQDEESWLDTIDPPYNQQCWDEMSACAEHVDAFVTVSEWYADEMAGRMSVDRTRVHVVPLGIELDGREPAEHSFDPPVLGYLSKMTHSLGLGTLTDAFITLKQNPKLSDLKLRATGGQHGGDRDYVASLRRKLATHGMEQDAEFLDGFALDERREFLRSLSVLSVPAATGEAFGMFITEALAAGVPVVQPNVGGFPEVVEATGGGIVYDAADPDALAKNLEALLLDPDRARALGEHGRQVVFERYGIDRMATAFAVVCESMVEQECKR